ncbi:MAG TPA: citryl-CoA lyase [Bauldia sp.]|nr:citryl-CoA lyase [Bauldia sp.]
MLIGKPGPARSAIAHATADRIEVRGRDLCGELMGHRTFTEMFYLLMTGEEPTADQRFFLDLLLVAIAEHGLTPTAVAARMTYDAAPDSLQGALAAGILGCGTVILGTAELCGAVLADASERVDAGASPQDAANAIAAEVRGRGERLPGFGHPLHRPVDPRTVRIFALAEARGVAGRHVDLARRLESAAARAWGRPLVMNVSMPIAAVLLDLGFPPTMIKAIPLLARTGGLLAHLAEEQDRPIGFLMAGKGEEAIAYDGGSGGDGDAGTEGEI